MLQRTKLLNFLKKGYNISSQKYQKSEARKKNQLGKTNQPTSKQTNNSSKNKNKHKNPEKQTASIKKVIPFQPNPFLR